MQWLSRWSRNRRNAPRSRPRCARLHLETLEERSTPTVNYYGGALLTKVQAQAVFYGSAWTATPAPSVSTTTLNNFVTSVVSSPYVEALTRAGYGVGDGSATPGYTDAATTPPARVTDPIIQAEVQSLVSSGKVSNPGANSLYVVFVQPYVVVDLGGGLTSATGLLGYHGAFGGVNTGGILTDIHYAVIAYPGGPNVSLFTPSNSTNDQNDLTTVASHEIAEGITDPNVDYKTLGWYDFRLNGEIGDITEGHNTTLTTSTGTYEVQQIASRADQPLALLPTSSLKTTTTTITPTAQSGQNVTFNVKVTPSSGSNPTGTVSLEEGNKIIGTPDLTVKNGQVTTTVALSPGTHTISAVYSGDSTFLGSFSGNAATVTVTTTTGGHHGGTGGSHATILDASSSSTFTLTAALSTSPAPAFTPAQLVPIQTARAAQAVSVPAAPASTPFTFSFAADVGVGGDQVQPETDELLPAPRDASPAQPGRDAVVPGATPAVAPNGGPAQTLPPGRTNLPADGPSLESGSFGEEQHSPFDPAERFDDSEQPVDLASQPGLIALALAAYLADPAEDRRARLYLDAKPARR